MLKNAETFEIMRPEDVGFTKTDLVLGKHSGRAALADRARALGYNLTGEQLNRVFEQFKELADRKKEVYDSDIAALCEQQLRRVPEKWQFVDYQIHCRTGQTPRVRLHLRHGQEDIVVEESCGDGPVDAIFLAIEKATGIHVMCRDFNVHSVSVGKDAQGEVTVEVEYQGQIHRGRGISTDSLEASAKAFLETINRVALLSQGQQAAQEAAESQP